MSCTIDSGFGGEAYKRKREEAQAMEDGNINGISSMEIDDDILPPAKRSAISLSSSDSASAVQVSSKAKRYRIKTAYRARLRQRNEEIRLIEAEKKEKLERREKKGKEKILRSGTKSETNPKPKVFWKKITKSKENELIPN